ncbi:hypothetical protein ACWEQU_30395, partial [Streptomyces nodosus]
AGAAGTGAASGHGAHRGPRHLGLHDLGDHRRPAARSAREPRTPDEAKVRAPRFGSFREAVRGARPDPTAPQDTTTETEPPQRTVPATPEGAHPPEAPEPHAPETAAADPVPEPTAPESAATPSHPEGDTTS